MKASTGIRNFMLDTGSLAAALADGVLRIYSNSVPAPASADDAIPGGAVLLLEISDNASGVDGLDFGAAGNGVISKDISQVWSGAALASGTGAWFRHVLRADDGSASTTAPRLQGSVGLAGADLNMETVTFVESEVYPITAYNIALPTL